MVVVLFCAGLELFQEEASEGRAAICVQEVRKEVGCQCHTGQGGTPSRREMIQRQDDAVA